MEQRDFILREIEKIGKMLNAIRRKLFGGKETIFVTVEEQYSDLVEMLLREVDFDLERILSPDHDKTDEYLSRFSGFNTENIEHLAEIISEIGFSRSDKNAVRYLEKALLLYDICNLRSKIYSLERETKIAAIKRAM